MSRDAVLDQALAQELVSCQNDDSFQTVLSGTMCTDDFYEGAAVNVQFLILANHMYNSCTYMCTCRKMVEKAFVIALSNVVATVIISCSCIVVCLVYKLCCYMQKESFSFHSFFFLLHPRAGSSRWLCV